jgi:RNA polymerase sigma factor (sigma-70 family)
MIARGATFDVGAASELGPRIPLDHGWPEYASAVSDEALVAAIATGDDTATAALIRRHERRVFGIALAITSDRATAEDVAQEAFLRVWRHAAVFDASRASPVTWISTITRNLAIDVVRARKATPVDPHEGLFPVNSPASEVSVEDRTVEADLVGKVRAAVDTLPLEQRRVLVRAVFYGQSTSEISVVEGIPLGTAKSRIRLALAKVRGVLATEKGAFDGPDS